MNFKSLKILLFTILSLGLSSAVALAQPAPKLSDAEIASAAVTANQIDVNHAILALERSDNPTVRKFALTMIRDHTSIIQQATALAQKLGVTPKTNAVTKSLLKGAKKATKMLKSKWGDAFDKAYINHEVAYHKAVISAIKNVLIPQTNNMQLKNFLKKAGPLLEHHLQMAEMDQQKIE